MADRDPPTIPLVPNPSGEPPNFVDPVDRFVPLVGVGSVLAAISLGFVAARFWVKFRSSRKVTADDYMCLTAWIAMAAYFGILCSFRTFTRHAWDIPLSAMTPSYIKRQFVLNLFSGPARWAAKATILMLYIQVFRPKKWLRYTCYVKLVFTFLIFWSMIPIAAVLCAPSPGQPWTRAVSAKCSKAATMGPILSVISTATDIFIFILPIPIVVKPQMTLKKRIGLLVVFSSALVAIAASATALAYTIDVFKHPLGSFWASGPLWTSILAESFSAIMISCSPALSSLWHNHVGSTFHTSVLSLNRMIRNNISKMSGRSTEGMLDTSPSRSESWTSSDLGKDPARVFSAGEADSFEMHTVQRPPPTVQGEIKKTITLEQSSKART